MGEKVIFVGAGGHALSLAEFCGEDIMGYLSKEENPEMPGKWLGTDDEAEKFLSPGHSLHVAYIYHGLPRMSQRGELIRLYQSQGWKFKTLISPKAIVTRNSKIAEGVAIFNGAIINRAEIGGNCVVNSGAIVEHDCKIGENTFIGPGAVIGGFTSIGKNCFIGLGARIGNGLKIGDNISVAMGAVVSKNLEEPGIYHGPTLKLFKFKD